MAVTRTLITMTKSLLKSSKSKPRHVSKRLVGAGADTRKVPYDVADANTNESDSLVKNILENTLPSRDHLTPELSLRLMTPSHDAWHRRPEEIRGEEGGRVGRKAHPNPALQEDPYWAIHWPGGQGIARYVLDHPHLTRGLRVLDLGCGCGAGAIAAAFSGASSVTANDVDRAALAATGINAEANGADKGIRLCGRNMLGDEEEVMQKYDVVLAGDLLYDEEVGGAVARLAEKFVYSGGGEKVFLLGDPGRWFLSEGKREGRGRWGGRLGLRCIAKYELTTSCREQHFGFTAAFVYQAVPIKTKIN